MRVVGFILTLTALMMGIGPYLALMLDVPSLIIVLGFTLGALLLGGNSLRLMVRGIAPASLSAAAFFGPAWGWQWS